MVGLGLSDVVPAAAGWTEEEEQPYLWALQPYLSLFATWRGEFLALLYRIITRALSL